MTATDPAGFVEDSRDVLDFGDPTFDGRDFADDGLGVDDFVDGSLDAAGFVVDSLDPAGFVAESLADADFDDDGFVGDCKASLCLMMALASFARLLASCFLNFLLAILERDSVFVPTFGDVRTPSDSL